MEDELKPVEDESEGEENPIAHEERESREDVSEALRKSAPEIATAKEAFKSFGKADMTETAERMLEIGRGDRPQIGALAFLHSDEEEAIEGYLKALPFFKGDDYGTSVLLNIIEDERRHERDLKELFGRYAAAEGEK